MSTNIEFRRWVLKTKAVKACYSVGLYLGFREAGDSNVIGDKGQIARTISMFNVDTATKFMQEIIHASAGCEGGMMRMAGSLWTKPENYIRAWRKALDEAVYIEDYLACNGHLTIRFNHFIEQLENDRRSLDLSKEHQRDRARMIDDLIIEIYSTEGVKEEVRQIPCYGSTYEERSIVFSFSKGNVDRLEQLLGKLASASVRLCSVFRGTDFHPQAYTRAVGIRDDSAA